MTELTFLGTGGGRFTTLSQLRQTGGIHIKDRGLSANLDPGPGALVHMHRYGIDPSKTDTVLVSHAHADHWTDASILLNGMGRGGIEQKGTLLAPRSVLRGVDTDEGRLGPVIAPWFQNMAQQVHEVEPGDTISVNDMYDVTATKQDHSDPDTVGFRLKLTHGQVSYIPDTQYFDGLADHHKGSRVVISQHTRGGSQRVPWHMCTDDVERLAEQIQPRLLLLTHFGYKQLKQGDPGEWAGRITERTGVPTVAARDGMRVTLDQEFSMDFLDKEGLPKVLA